ncbi:MAG TPA: NADH-quinone oxidoreductase subunit L [Actinomycetes bacterium]
MTLVVLAILAPAVAAVTGLLSGGSRPRVVAPLAIGGTAVAFAATVVLALRAVVDAPLRDGASITSVPTGTVPFGIDLRLDGLAALVSLAVGAVALAVQIYSTAYLKGDPRYSSYAAFVSLFTAAMLLVVFANDLLVLLVGWEVMGACSYFLIGHHWEQEGARSGAVKAIVVTRLGDVGFLFGIFTLGFAAGTFNIAGVEANVLGGAVPESTATVATLLVLCGVVGKSAQFPLHTWLPDAMAGPTPVSALIHAATMVAAGIYLVSRLYDVFLAAPATLALMAVIAAVTMLGAALAGLAQADIKRVLAYSTVSQLAYMLAGLAVGSYTAADFHLLTHAAFKALLFLAAGSVIHVVGTNLMGDMGGLRRLMPITFVTMTLGLAALVGLPPLAGFFSKEAVLGAAEEAALHDGPVAPWAAWLVLVVGLVTVAVTAAYAARLWLMTFFDRPRSPVAVHEAPGAMRWPLVALAVPTVGLGLVGLQRDWLPLWLGRRGPVTAESGLSLAADVPTTLHLSPVTSVLSTVLAVAGAGAVFLLWRRDRAADPVAVVGRVAPVLAHAFYVDELYDRVVVRPVRVASRAVGRTDEDVVDATVVGSGRLATRLAGLVARTQAGNVQAYLTGLLAGVVVLAVGVVTLT